ncbi:MAG: HEAT repeat domain-containing protein [Euryarchaeota archaeon]|nr:HEAT repeat domain-containing protein [Euryarchaeota archaeon]
MVSPNAEFKPDVEDMKAKRDVEGLIRSLSHEDHIIRKESARALIYVGDERAVEPLIKALKYEDWQESFTVLTAVRENAAEGLGRIGDKKALKPLIQALKDKDGGVRWKAAWSLGRIGDKGALEPLIEALNDEDGDVRKHAAGALGNIRDERAVEPLIQALNDEDWPVRKCVVTALGKIGDERALGPLIHSLGDEDGDVRWKAMSAIGKMGTLALAPLINLLDNEDWRLRSRAAEALGKIGDERAVEPLILILSDKKYRDKNRYVRGRAAESLGRLGDETAVEALNQALNEEYIYVRRKAADALERIELSVNFKDYENEEISFNYPPSWEIESGTDGKEIVKGHWIDRDIKFSIKKRSNVGDLTLKEFADLVKDVFLSQDKEITYEMESEVDGMDAYELISKELYVDVPTKIRVLALKKEDTVYYIWFTGESKEFDDSLEYMDVIINSFHLK